ncbi:MAG TPA: hypothetical protein VL856_14100 [Acidimicrobiia bacterium]|nr:hypothetical protein [Acidimicrobiia bacterium]
MKDHRTYRGRCQFGHQGAIQRAALTADSRNASIELSSVFPRRSLSETIAFDDIVSVGEARVLADRGVACRLNNGRTLYFWSRRYHGALLDELRSSGVHFDERVEYVAPMGARG